MGLKFKHSPFSNLDSINFLGNVVARTVPISTSETCASQTLCSALAPSHVNLHTTWKVHWGRNQHRSMVIRKRAHTSMKQHEVFPKQARKLMNSWDVIVVARTSWLIMIHCSNILMAMERKHVDIQYERLCVCVPPKGTWHYMLGLAIGSEVSKQKQGQGLANPITECKTQLVIFLKYGVLYDGMRSPPAKSTVS
eukprot:3878954-Amphidinium_carterae.1